MANGQCTIGARHEAEISALQKEAAERAAEDQRQWTALGEARDRFEEALRLVSSRMPNWGVAVMAAGSGVGGAIIGVLGTLLAVGKG